jgi:hypothetical protein
MNTVRIERFLRGRGVRLSSPASPGPAKVWKYEIVALTIRQVARLGRSTGYEEME